MISSLKTIVSSMSSITEDNDSIEKVEDINCLNTRAQVFGQQLRDDSEKQNDLNILIKSLELSENELHCNVRNNIDALTYMQEKINTLSSMKMNEVRKQEFDDLIANIKENIDVVTKAQEFTAKHFGVQVNIKQIDQSIFEVQFIFSGNNFAIVDYNLEDQEFNLKSMKPEHPNLEKIKSFLRETTDISGFLYNARNFFKSIDNRNL